MEKERKLRFFLIRLLFAGGICLIMVALKLAATKYEVLEKVFEYLSSDIVFLQ